ncbi:SDR family NAD(P)-dependent oxidoreductase [Streptomyces aureus]|uniref:SDR family NAD(P)-dependent oxidoreductase n=1 Tax=Streptomyces aureus TaxID=193461 RepID=A0ABV4SRE8_9ACTN
MSESAPGRVLVSGGTSAIGASVVRLLAGRGAQVIFTGRDKTRADVLADETGAAFVAAEARDAAQVRAAAAHAVENLGGLDALVLATGVLHLGPLASTSDAAWDHLVDVNLKSAFAWSTACLPALRASSGSIVAIASAAAVWPDTAAPAYAVTKRALLALTQMLAAEAAPDVRVNAVCPGDTAAGMTATVTPGRSPASDGELPRPPLGRHIEPEDVAQAVGFFLSDSASLCTGQFLCVDGGTRGAHRS